ncbi:MAG TPA: hypothetical protein VGC99_21175, partial [Candidatus Tectomicrobia bacterium]
LRRPPWCSWQARRALSQDVGNVGGSVGSPVLAKVYVHYALDLWVEQVGNPRCRGEALLSRYADDLGCAFRFRSEAEGCDQV